ncbi:MAG: hypothetical protein IKH41_05085 [Clostridia bacterium]|nr:hypothetical protein [Clostridia bacterium]
MDETGFFNWYIIQGKASTAKYYIKDICIIENVFGKLDILHKQDHCNDVFRELNDYKIQLKTGSVVKDFFKISHIKDPVHRLNGMISALKKYVRFLDTKSALPHNNIPQPPVATRSNISYGNAPYRFPKVLDDISDNYSEPSFIQNVFYEEEINSDSDLLINGLLRFLIIEIELIYGSLTDIYHNDFLNDVFGVKDTYRDAFKRIPIIIRRGTPVKHYYCDIDLVNEAIKRKNKTSDIFKKELLDLIERNRFNMPICGLYHSDGGQKLPEIRNNNNLIPFTNNDRTPYIELFYRNIDCNGADDYMASLAMVLAHEMFHFFHDHYTPLQFNKRKSVFRDPITEATADFFSLFHLIRWSNNTPTIARFECAQNRHSAWKYRFGSIWPYAYALYFLIIKGSELPFSTNTDYYNSNKCLEKLRKVINSSKYSMKGAYYRLISY